MAQGPTVKAGEQPGPTAGGGRLIGDGDGRAPRKRGAAPPRRPRIRDAASCLVSLAAHMLLLVFLGLQVVPPPPFDEPAELEVVPVGLDEVAVEQVLDDLVADLPVDVSIDLADIPDRLVASVVSEETLDFPLVNDRSSATTEVERSETGSETAPSTEVQAAVGGTTGKALEGRGEGMRAELTQRRGGTSGSERAVARALRWFQRHQNPNGSWSLDHRMGACQGRCSQPGRMAPSANGATALALLPFLGAGQTHQEGNYQKTVDAGLYYLVRAMQVAGAVGSWHEQGGTMYSHGLASIAVCEAYAMTGDQHLMAPSRLGLHFIVAAQDPVGGGWRYVARQPGDTSVVGWQLMALKSGHMATLDVPPLTFKRASRFLSSVQKDGGAFYGYVESGRHRRFGTTAVGLLCRMYLGWKRDHPALQRGVAWIGAHGPDDADLYANYYATQVVFHYTGGEGPMWERWNNQLRDGLVHSQEKEGHAKGSWYVPAGPYVHSNEAGGRIFCTSMATMMLEIYYRHLPIFGVAATEDTFPSLDD